MHICHVTTTFNSRSGSARRILKIMEESARRGHVVTLVSGPDNDVASLEAPCFEHKVVPSLVKHLAPIRDLRSLASLVRCLAVLQPDILHTHLAKAGVLARFAQGALRRRVPVIHTVHGPTFTPLHGNVERIVYWAFERLAAKLTDHFVYVGEDLMRSYLDSGVGSPDNSSVIYTGKGRDPLACYRRMIAVDKLNQVRSRFTGGIPQYCIANVGRLVPSKNIGDSIEVLARIRGQGVDVGLLVVGDALVERERCHKKELVRLARDLGVEDWVCFTGFEDDVCAIIRGVDCVVSTSRYEGLSNVAVESVLAGTPVVGYGVYGMRELFENSNVPFVVEPGRVDDLSNLVVDVTRRQEVYRSEVLMVQRNINHRFSDHAMVSATNDLYERFC